MSVRSACGKAIVLGSVLALAVPLCSTDADAAPHSKSGKQQLVHTAAYTAGHVGGGLKHFGFHKGSKGGHFARWGGISCVPFARGESGIELAGNAWAWWDNAEGVYARGSRPEPGSVLAFRATGHMRLGHVAVVSEVVNSREIIIDHANWSGGRVSRGVSVVDVSPGNDWSQVRVGLGQTGDYGSAYPTYGFIYDRPDRGGPVPATAAPLVQAAATPQAADVAEEEVAELPPTRHVRHAHHRHHH
jgi:hypothetical protein